jgi:hypothetical protein
MRMPHFRFVEESFISWAAADNFSGSPLQHRRLQARYFDRSKLEQVALGCEFGRCSEGVMFGPI